MWHQANGHQADQHRTAVAVSTVTPSAMSRCQTVRRCSAVQPAAWLKYIAGKAAIRFLVWAKNTNFAAYMARVGPLSLILIKAVTPASLIFTIIYTC